MRSEPTRKDVDAIMAGLYNEAGFLGTMALDALGVDHLEKIVRYVIKCWSVRCTQSGLFGEVKG